MLEGLKFLSSLYRQGKLKELLFNRPPKSLQEYMDRNEEAFKKFDANGIIDSYLKIFGYFDYFKNEDYVKEFMENYRVVLKQILPLCKDCHDRKITDSELVAEVMKLPTTIGRQRVNISCSKGEEGLNISWSIKS